MLIRCTGAALALGVAFAAQAEDLPGFEVRSTASFEQYPANYYGADPSQAESQSDQSAGSGQTAAVLGDGYVATARTQPGRNQAFVRYDRDGQQSITRAGSSWYERMTISGGTGTGTATFNVRLRGVVDSGRDQGGLGFTLSATSAQPAEPDVIGFAGAWQLDPAQTTKLIRYTLATSPYNDTSRIAGSYGSEMPSQQAFPQSNEIRGIPSISDSGGGTFPNGPGMTYEPVPPDTILAPGAGQIVDLVLTGTFSFTYGEAFYLVGDLSAFIGDGLQSFTFFGASDQSASSSEPDTDIPTMLDFGNGAFLSSILLPDGAVASFASGTPYNVATAPVPEPGEWALLLAGLGLVGWRARQRG